MRPVRSARSSVSTSVEMVLSCSSVAVTRTWCSASNASTCGAVNCEPSFGARICCDICCSVGATLEACAYLRSKLRVVRSTTVAWSASWSACWKRAIAACVPETVSVRPSEATAISSAPSGLRGSCSVATMRLAEAMASAGFALWTLSTCVRRSMRPAWSRMSTMRRNWSLSLVSALTTTLRASGPAAMVTALRCAGVCRSRIFGMMLVASELRSGISVTTCGSASISGRAEPGVRRSPSSASMSAAPSATLCAGPTIASLPTSSMASTVGFTSLGSCA